MEESESRIRVIGGLGAGTLLALGVSLIEGSRSEFRFPELPAAGPVNFWAVDRGAQEICGLDADLFLARRRPLAGALAVRARADGGAWVLRSRLGRPGGPCCLDRIESDGSIAVEVELGACGPFAVLDSGAAVVVEKGTGQDGADRILRCGDPGGTAVLLEERDLSCVIVANSRVLAGTSRGEILRFRSDAGAASVERTLVEGAIVDLEPGPRDGSVWILFGERGSRIGLLGSDFVLRESVSTGLRSAHVAPVEGEERFWIADLERGIVRRYGPAGVLELDRADLPLPGIDRIVPLERGSALLVAPGAILHVDRRGRLLPGQGGFDFLTDLDRIPRPPP